MVKMKFVLFTFTLLPAVILCATVNLLDLTPEEAQRLIAEQNLELSFAKKLSSFPLPEPVLEKTAAGEDVKRGVVFYNGRPIENYANFYEDNYEASQFHGQDGLGRYIFGFSGPHHSRVETRTADGEVRGSYQYIGPYDQPIKVEYWADKDGFHQVDNLGLEGPKPVEETPEVKQARLEHERLWKEAAEAAGAHPDPLSDVYNKHALAFDAAQEKVDHETEYNKPSDEFTRYPKLPYSEHIKPDKNSNLQEGVVIENASTKTSEDGEHFPPKGFFYSFAYPVRDIVQKEGTKEVLNEEYAQGKKPFPLLPPGVADNAQATFATSIKMVNLTPHYRTPASNIEAEVPQESIVVEKVHHKNVLHKVYEKDQMSEEKPIEFQVPVELVPVRIVPVQIVTEMVGVLDAMLPEVQMDDVSSEETDMKVDETENGSTTSDNKTVSPTESDDSALKDLTDSVVIDVSDEQSKSVRTASRLSGNANDSEKELEVQSDSASDTETTTAADENHEESLVDKHEEIAKKDLTTVNSESSDDKITTEVSISDETTEEKMAVSEGNDQKNNAEPTTEQVSDAINSAESTTGSAPATVADSVDEVAPEESKTVEVQSVAHSETAEVTNDEAAHKEETNDQNEDIKEVDHEDRVKDEADKQDGDKTESGKSETVELAPTETAKSELDIAATEKSEDVTQKVEGDQLQVSKAVAEEVEAGETTGKTDEEEKKAQADEAVEKKAQADEAVENKTEMTVGDNQESKLVESEKAVEHDKIETNVENSEEKEEHKENDDVKEADKVVDISEKEIAGIVDELTKVVNNQALRSDESSKQVQADTIAKADSLINAMKEYFSQHGIDITESDSLVTREPVTETVTKTEESSDVNSEKSEINASRDWNTDDSNIGMGRLSLKAAEAGAIPVAAVHDAQVPDKLRGDIVNSQLLPVFQENN